MTLQRGSDDLVPIYRNCLFRSDSRVSSHSHVARELIDHQLHWIRGAVDAAMFKGELRRLRMYVLRYGAEVEVTPKPFDDFTLVHMSLRGAAQIDSDGHRVDVPEGRTAVIAPRRAIRLRWHEGTEQLILKIPHALIREVGDRQDDELQLAPCHLISGALGSQWNFLARSLLNVMRLPPDSGLNQAWVDHYERSVVLFLLAHQAEVAPSASIANSPSAVADAADERPSHDAQRMDAMLQYMNSRLCAPISLYDLAAAAGVSARTLNALCHRHHGSTPMELLRNRRLDAVHEKLRLNPNVSIAATALDFGFGHLGRFAAYYAERFGELPRRMSVRQHNSPGSER